MKVNEKVECHRLGNGKLSACVFPGGYPLSYLIDDGESICPACANGENGSEATLDPEESGTGWLIVDVYVHWEGPMDYCAHCQKPLETAYGNPDRDSKAESIRDLRRVQTEYLTIRERNQAIRINASISSRNTSYFGEDGNPKK